MAVAVINRISLTIPAGDLGTDIDRELPAVIRTLRGFQAFHLVEKGDQEVTAIILWDDAEAAKAGADVLGSTLFRTRIAPHATAQDRVIGQVLVSG